MNALSFRLTSIVVFTIAITSSRASAWAPAPQDAPDAPPPKEAADKPDAINPPKKDPKAADGPKTVEKPKAGQSLQTKSQAELLRERRAKAAAARKAAALKRKSETNTNAARGSAEKKRRTKAKAKLQMNPDAKWSCDQQTAELEPVWRGEKTLTFPFLIRNDGTADLEIRAKGG